jgi:hypothetical protein
MSSDSEASHSSAQRDEDGAATNGEELHDFSETSYFRARQHEMEDSDGSGGGSEDEGQELASTGSGSHGFTFARVQRRPAWQSPIDIHTR